MNYLKITDIDAYTTAFNLSNMVWDVVVEWNYLAQKTIGVQIIRSVDSISANIAEGFGRYHKKDKIKFYYYARASTVETFDWLEKSIKRNLISQNQYIYLKEELDKIPKAINTLVSSQASVDGYCHSDVRKNPYKRATCNRSFLRQDDKTNLT